MTKKELIIQQINEFENKYFNQDQKKIMVDIIQNASEVKAQVYFDFLKYKRRNGFTFDYSPEIAMGRIIKLYEDKKRSINVDDEVTKDENKLIIGDNYNALKSLLVTHKNRINIIYIDPPYNTESAKDDGNQSSKEGVASKFIYKDKFGRGGWLNMMKQRLDLAKELLSEDGVIFVSIDDQEQAYLKVLMDEIFGEENFCNTLIWEKNYAPKSNNKKFSVNHDYVLVYFKNYLIYENKYKKINPEPKKESQLSHYKYDDNDGRGVWRSDNLTIYGDKNNYPIINPETGIKYYPKKNKNWIFNSCKMQKMIAENRIQFPKNGAPNLKRYLKEVREGITPLSIISYQKGGHTHKASQELESILFIKDLFPFPKPSLLIKYLINRIKHKNAIILDFFAGSGTTGQAVMELNREDGGHRQFILCTNNENSIAENITYERLHRVILGEGTKGEKNFKWFEKNKPYKNEKLRVIWIDDTIKINNDLKNGEEIENDILKGLKLLDPSYSQDNLNFYYDLAALNPLENE